MLRSGGHLLALSLQIGLSINLSPDDSSHAWKRWLDNQPNPQKNVKYAVLVAATHQENSPLRSHCFPYMGTLRRKAQSGDEK